MVLLSNHLAKFRQAPGKESRLLHWAFAIIKDYDILARELYRLRASTSSEDPLRRRVEDSVSNLAQDLIGLQDRGKEDSPYTLWKRRYHQIWRENVPLLLLTVATFLATLTIGWVVATRTPEYTSVLLPHRIIEDVLEKRRWFSDLEAEPLFWGLFIAWNNIQVSIVCFLMGVFFGLGTLFYLAVNGIHIGAIMGFCYVHGFQRELTSFILGHGPLELSIIVAASFAGFLFGRVFYMRPFKKVVTRIPHATLDALCVMYGVLPWLLLAASIEVGLSPIEGIDLSLKLLIGLVAALCFWVWTFVPARNPSG